MDLSETGDSFGVDHLTEAGHPRPADVRPELRRTGMNSKNRKLALHRETLRTLTAADLSRVVGGEKDWLTRHPNFTKKSYCVCPDPAGDTFICPSEQVR